MKKLFYLVLAAVLFAVGCSESFDDSKIWDKLDDHESRISQLEELCKQMNTNISSLQTLVSALNQKEFITNVAPISKNGEEIGYTITFTSGKTITIYHGQDGADGKDGINGENGADGKDGKDGLTPIIGVKLFNGVYYWTLNGEWLLDDDGNKIKAVGTDGKDGQNGADGADGKDGQDGEDGKDGQDGNDGATGPQGPQGPAGENGADGEDGKDGQNGADGKDGEDGITPQLKIEEGYWYISYDNGSSWKQLGKATGEDGKDGQDGQDGKDGKDGLNGGDSFFQNVTQDEHNVYFTLADGTEIVAAKYIALQLYFDISSLTDVKVNSEVKVNYTVATSASKVDIEVLPSNDLRAEVVADDATNKTGYILIRTSNTFDAASKVVVLVSDGEKVVMKSISLQVIPEEEAAQLYIYNGATKNVGSAGGTATLSFLTNVDCEAVIPDDAKSWISVAETRALENKHITLTVAENTSDRRSAKVKVQSLDGKLSVEYTISQAAPASPSTPEVGGDGAILGTPANNEIFYTSTNGKVIEPYKTEAFGAAIVSNTYANGVGVIVFDRNITTIGEVAFYHCSSLTSITIPDSVTTIGERAFDDCDYLKSITIPDSVTEIGEKAFYYCSSLTSITIPDSVTTIGDEAFYGCKSLTSITIPDSVTTIGDKAFCNCSSLTSVTIPDSVTEIGYRAFLDCSSLTSVTIPDSVTTIGIDAFWGCSSLTSVTIPDSVTTIGIQAFRDCSSLTTITIPDSVTTIGNYAFLDCSSLTSVTIPDSVTTIGNKVFSGCSSLTTITIPDSVTAIGYSAFHGCSSLTTAVIGSGVKSIGYSAFENCYFLNEVICKPTTPPTAIFDSGATEWNAFNAIGTSAKIYVPYESVEAYRTADYWKDYANYIVAYDFDKGEIVPESRNNQIFYTATAKIEVEKAEDFGANCISNEWDSTTGEGVMTFDADVTKVGVGAFSWRTKLTSVTLPSSVKTIETYAFSNCNVLKNVNIPDGVTAIGNEAFKNCYRLEQISLPEGLKSIGEYAFNKCTDLTAVVIPNSVTSIGQCAFLDCDSLTNATLGSGIKEISRCLFGGTCLHSINIPNGVTTIAREAFISCWRLTSVTIPDSVEYIGQESFASCNNMQSVTIGSGVTTIMDSAFEYCSRLKEVFCKPTTPPILGYCVFDSNASDRKIYVPESANDVVIDAYKSAKNWDSYTDVIVEKAM